MCSACSVGMWMMSSDVLSTGGSNKTPITGLRLTANTWLLCEGLPSWYAALWEDDALACSSNVEKVGDEEYPSRLACFVGGDGSDVWGVAAGDGDGDRFGFGFCFLALGKLFLGSWEFLLMVMMS